MYCLKHSINNKSSNNRSSWDDYWGNHFGSKRTRKIIHFLRTKLNAKAVAYFAKRYFQGNGIFVEMGSGSSQTSVLIPKESRLLFSYDFVFEPLTQAKELSNIEGGVQGDLLYLPFCDNSINGIWNMGVMEHFTNNELDVIFDEFSRVLKADAYAILFWPTLIGWYKAGSIVIETILRVVLRRKVKLYPDEINLFRSKKKIEYYCKKNRFVLEKCSRNYLDAFNHMVIIIRKCQ
jgi:SAM-dependent methyltransferase